MASNLRLKAEKREIVGKKVKKLRNQGLVPAHVFGTGTQPLNLQLNTAEFLKIFQDAGETSLIELQLEGESQPRQVLITGVQKNPLSDQILHLDLHQVVLTEEVEVEIPLRIEEELAPAVRDHKGIILRQLDLVATRALPANLPEEIEVDVSGLAGVGDTIYVRDLRVPPDIRLLTDPDQVVCVVELEVSARAEEEAKAEEAKAEPEAVSEAPAEAPAEAPTEPVPVSKPRDQEEG